MDTGTHTISLDTPKIVLLKSPSARQFWKYLHQFRHIRLHATSNVLKAFAFALTQLGDGYSIDRHDFSTGLVLVEDELRIA